MPILVNFILDLPVFCFKWGGGASEGTRVSNSQVRRTSVAEFIDPDWGIKSTTAHRVVQPACQLL
jgi:hypothetical protein